MAARGRGVAPGNQVTHKLHLVRHEVDAVLQMVGDEQVVFPGVTHRQRPAERLIT